MKKAFLGFLVFVFVIFVGCDNFTDPSITDPPISVPKQLSDSRFNGEFWWHGTGTFFSCWEFNGTNKAEWSVNTNNYIYDISIFEIEIKLENGHLWSRLWNNEFSDWDDDGIYSFDNAGNLILDGIIYEKDGNSRSVMKMTLENISGKHEEYLHKKIQKIITH